MARRTAPRGSAGQTCEAVHRLDPASTEGRELVCGLGRSLSTRVNHPESMEGVERMCEPWHCRDLSEHVLLGYSDHVEDCTAW